MSLKQSAAGAILHNSFWYGLETLLEAAIPLATSIAVANYLGPRNLGYFSYINFFVMAVNRTSGSGLSSATRKYMAEFLVLDQPGMARAVYDFAFRYQMLGAFLIVALGLGGIALFGDPPFKLMASLLVLSIIPGSMASVPAQANLAFQDQSKNTLSAFGYLFSYAAIILLTLHFHWGLVGIASASLFGRCLEAVLRIVPLHLKMRSFARGTLPDELTARIRRFCFQAIGIQLLMVVVWDRSEMVFLRAFSTLEQIGFYSISFGLVNNLLTVPRTFGGATGVTLMVEAQREPERVDSIVRNASRYLMLVVLPVHLGAAAITTQVIRFAYASRYTGAIPVMIIASILAIPRAFQEIPEVLLRAADRQKRLFLWLALTGGVNLALDFLLIPRFGAVGAALGNGISQTFGIIAVWQQARRVYTFSLPTRSTLRLLLASVSMAAMAYGIGHAVSGGLGLILAVLAAAPVYILLVKLLHGLVPSDRLRLAPIGNRFPGSMRRAFLAMVEFVTPAST